MVTSCALIIPSAVTRNADFTPGKLGAEATASLLSSMVGGGDTSGGFLVIPRLLGVCGTVLGLKYSFLRTEKDYNTFYYAIK